MLGNSSLAPVQAFHVGNDPATAQDGFVSLPPEEQRILKPINRQNSTVDRASDTEYKILENFAHRNIGNPGVQGSVNLFTERAPCTSCTGVIRSQFSELFPNMEVRVFHGNGEITVYKGAETTTTQVSVPKSNSWPTIPGGEVVPPRSAGGQ